MLKDAGGAEEVDAIVVVLSQAGADGEDVGVEDDVLRVEAHLQGWAVLRRQSTLVLMLRLCEKRMGTALLVIAAEGERWWRAGAEIVQRL